MYYNIFILTIGNVRSTPVFLAETKMNVTRQLLEAVHRTNLKQRSTARAFQEAIEIELRKKAWKVVREFRVKDRGDGTPGRIDLAVMNPLRIGIELDRATIRKKSLFKLAQFDGLTFVILRQSARVVQCKPRGDELNGKR